MKKTTVISVFVILLLTFTSDVLGQSCSGGKINGIYYTSCFTRYSNEENTGVDHLNVPITSGSGTTVAVPNDTRRLKDAIVASLGRLVFNEGDYYIDEELPLYSYRTLEGTGRSSYLGTINGYYPNHPSSKIIQTEDNLSIFKIGEGITDVAIRDLALVAGYGTSGTIGILAQGGSGTNQSSISFQFSNLKFSGFSKGIYVNATNDEWQFDNIRLDHSYFESCATGIYIDSYNSGWNITSIDFLVPANGYGIYMEKSTYTSMSMLIGNGPISAPYAEALIYVKDHGNLSIRNAVSEGFNKDLDIDGDSIYGTGLTYPIYLMNNTFMNGISIKDSTVISTANQFGFGLGDVPALAKGTSRIYSIGDKFCFEGASCETNKTYTLQDDAKLVFGSNKYKTEVDTLMLGTRLYAGLGTPANGTLYYCSNCQQTSTCASGGTGAIAKRINSAWKCN